MTTTTVVVLGAAIVYFVIGLCRALQLARDGHPGTAAAAVFTWPLLLESAPEKVPHRTGPFAPAIRKGANDLRSALTEPGVDGLFQESDVQRIEHALFTADARVGTVDRLLADPAVRDTTEGQKLRRARDQAAAEVEAVLKGLVQLRVQLGLVALAGETGPVRDRLMELSARLTALEEVGTR